MLSQQQDVAKSNISPVLFMTVDGEPMSFFLRPGPVKCKLQPLIIGGGGILCNVQQPGAILLIDPIEGSSIAETTAHWYVSTKYIHDCIEKNEQLNLDDYRLKPVVAQRHPARLNNTKENCSAPLGGRLAYTAEDDAAILTYVSKHEKEIGGNRLWQEMEKQQVTNHSWQSMKYRYRVRLAKKQSEAVEVATTEEQTEAAEGEAKVERNEETEVEKPSSAEDAASPQTHLTQSDQTQIDALSISDEKTQPEIVEAQTSVCPQEEPQHVNPETDEQPAECTKGETAEAETCKSPQPEGPCLDPPTDSHTLPTENTESETDEAQTVVSPPKKSTPEDFPQARPKSLSDTSSKKKPKEKQRSSPRLEQLQRRVTRRQLQLEESSSSAECHGKKLRLTSTPEQPSSSLQPPKKTKSALQKDATTDQPPSKKSRGSLASVAENQSEKSRQDTVSETAQADAESISVPQIIEKKKEKRKLGILEMATKEFEDESESDEDEAPDLQNPTETAMKKPTEAAPPLPTQDAVASAQSSPAHGPCPQEILQEAQASGSNCPPAAGRPGPATTEAVCAASKAHLFIFDSESQEDDSQEDDSQSIFCNDTAAPANPPTTVNTDCAFSLTQAQLEEDKQRIRELMEETNKDLVSVTKALLKTSGDFSEARDLLFNPYSISGPLWQCCDDDLLTTGDPVVRQQLQEKYGEELLAKRVVFLELEG